MLLQRSRTAKSCRLGDVEVVRPFGHEPMQLQKILDHKSPREHYKTDACLVWCFDDRFAGLLDAFIAKMGYKSKDLVKVAGGSKELTSLSTPEGQVFLGQILKSIALHHTHTLILMVHSECGAYGKIDLAECQTERDFLSSELLKAKEVVESALREHGHSHVKIDLYLADFDGLYQLL